MHSAGNNSIHWLLLFVGIFLDFFSDKKKTGKVREKNKINDNNPCSFIFWHIRKTGKVREKCKNNDKNPCDSQFNIWRDWIEKLLLSKNNNFFRGPSFWTPIKSVNWVQNVTIKYTRTTFIGEFFSDKSCYFASGPARREVRERIQWATLNGLRKPPPSM